MFDLLAIVFAAVWGHVVLFVVKNLFEKLLQRMILMPGMSMNDFVIGFVHSFREPFSLCLIRLYPQLDDGVGEVKKKQSSLTLDLVRLHWLGHGETTIAVELI